MRLSKKQVEVLILATHKFFGATAQIWLFGSRVDDAKKGGDIDLYIETDLNEHIMEAKLKMLTFLWDQFEEQKIDLIIKKRSDESSPIQTIAQSTGVLLER